MSKPSKSQSQAKTSSSTGSICHPTAHSPSIVTADDITDPPQIPTARSNSVNTAIGATPSDFDTSGMSDTSAGSNRNVSNSEPKTAKSQTSPEKIMNELKRGSLFGRGTQSQTTDGPMSVTNITFASNNTNISTASDGNKLDNSQASGKSGKLGKRGKDKKSGSRKSHKSAVTAKSKSMKTGKELGKSRFSAKKLNVAGPSSTNAFSTGSTASSISRNSKMKSPKQKMKSLKTHEKEFSGKSAKSQKSQKSTKSSDFSQTESVDLSVKSAKSAKSAPRKAEKAEISKKSTKKTKMAASSGGPAAFGKSGVVKKGDQSKKSVYFPQVNNPNQSVRRPGANRNTQQPPYNFPGTGRCTRSMDVLAPVTQSAPPANASHCVYDVATLDAAQRRVPPQPMIKKEQPKSLFGAKKGSVPSAPLKPETVNSQNSNEEPLQNKIVVLGATKDGKTMIQMTIDMKIVAGEALGGSTGPVDLVPKKILVGGQEIKVESKAPKTGQ